MIDQHSGPPSTGEPRSVRSADGTPIGYRSLGAGPGLVVVGGALRTSRDYLELGRHLAPGCTVHLMDRRGRGTSGPQGPGYGLDTEIADLLAVQADTGARWVFGHSYGGLVALECARTQPVFARVAVYEPGVSAGPFPTSWMEGYRRRLAAGDERGAFAEFVRGSGGAPAALRMMPAWYLGLVLRVGFRGAGWQRIRELLPANLAEHEQVAARAGHLAEYGAVDAPVLLLTGSRSSGSDTTFDELAAILRRCTHTVLSGLDHFGPEGRTAARVAAAVRGFVAPV
jgi:pimeloyl-ACP methyl ester carboxylesterase